MSKPFVIACLKMASLLAGALYAAPALAQTLPLEGALREPEPVAQEQVSSRQTGQLIARESQDPADRVEPPGLVIQPGTQTISPFLALAMEEELSNLMGRFESALLLGSVSDYPEELNVGAREKADLSASEAAESPYHPALAMAQRTLDGWSGWLRQRDYATARSQWLSARQALWNEFPRNHSLAQAEVRAMWLDRGTIVRAGSKRGMAQIFERLAAAGINTVFVETVNAGYPIYPSEVAPEQNPMTRHWDPLAAAVELGKEHDIEVHAWMWLFAAGNRRHNHLLNLPNDYPGPLLSANPTWAGYSRRGQMIPVGQDKPFLDPANPQVRSYLLRQMREIVTNYDVDGIQFDYVRYPFQDPSADRTYGYGLEGRLRFRELTGVDPATLSPRRDPKLSPIQQRRRQQLWNRWTEFRIEQVSSFVAEASTMLRQQRPDLTISAAVFAKPTHERRQKIQQDWEDWARRGDVDWIVLMSYAMDTSRFEELIHPWVLNNDYGSTLIIPGIRLLNLPDMAAFDQIQTLRDLPVSGYALFAADNLQRGIQTLLNNTQGPAVMAETQPVPQRQPFVAAAERYRLLQREWSWLLSNDQLNLADGDLENWIERVNQLGEDINRLADEPSYRQLNQVERQLSQLMEIVDDGVINKTVNHQYRQRVWRHRLVSIERMLAYGRVRQL